MVVPHKIRDEVKKDIVEQVAERIEKSNEKLGDRLIDRMDKNHQEMMHEMHTGFLQIANVFGNVAENLSKMNKTLEKIEKKMH